MAKISRILVWAVSIALAVFIIVYIISIAPKYEEDISRPVVSGDRILLPLPRKISVLTVEEAILLRRSIREFADEPIDLNGLAMILWATYGITEPRLGFRAVPSAGATYPLEVYVVVGKGGVKYAEGFIAEGVYKYEPHSHSLLLVKSGDYRRELMEAALGQSWVGTAPVNIVICAVFERTTWRYGERGRVRYVPMEVGHAGQNIYLMATALGYGTVVVGAFYDDNVASIIGAKPEEKPLYIVPIGVPRRPHRMSFEDVWDYILANRGERRG